MSSAYPDWNDVILPVLREIYDAEREGRPDRAMATLQERVDGNMPRFDAAVRRINDDGLAQLQRHGGGRTPIVMTGLSPDGMRAIGEWPTNDFAAALSTALEQAIEQASSVEERSRLQKVLAAASRVTEASSAGLITAVIRAAGGI